MPKGFAGIREIAAQQASGGRLFFKLADGEKATVRFLEQGDDPVWSRFHKVEVPDRDIPKNIVCLNWDNSGTPCPGCEQEIPRTFRGFINLIWRNAPEDGKDKVAIWESGITVFETLDDRDALFKGLTSRDFEVSRKGKKFDTTYKITPLSDEPTAPSKADKKLSEDKYDLNELIQPLSYEQFEELLNRSDESENAAPARPKNPFFND